MSLNLEPTDLEQRAAVGMYQLLATLWCSEVNEVLLSELQSGTHEATFAEHQFFSAGEAIDVSILAADYCQLFVGPRNHLPPYQSVWEEGQLAGRAAASMRGYCELLERPLLRREIEADHLGHQLAMMGNITAGMMTACRTDDSVVAYEEMGREFFTTHLRWPASLLARVEGQAQTQFYRALSRCTSGFLEIQAAFWR
ncbi:MAG: molecular chaperone TorD family protein [Planctomycetota bacterium]|nr:molecular chaperone TorD family protein [Planctomycetota bacterium]